MPIKTSYIDEIKLFKERATLVWFLVLLVALGFAPIVGRLIAGDYIVSLLNMVLITSVAAMGLNILTGWTGLISMGHAAFLAIGAYSSALLTGNLSIPFLLALPLSGLIAAVIGFAVGLPALRIKGIYLAIATLAFAAIVDQIILNWDSLTNGADGLVVPKPVIFGFAFSTELRFYYLAALVVIGLTFMAVNLRRTRIGRGFIAVRESDLAAEVMGINLAKYKPLAFTICAFYAGIAGSLYAHHISYIGTEDFTFFLSIEYLVIILIGGIGSIFGSILGAAFMTLFPEIIKMGSDALRPHFPGVASAFPSIRVLIFAATMIFFIIFEPLGLNGYWLKIKRYFSTWPF